jgi:hypothetical protein
MDLAPGISGGLLGKLNLAPLPRKQKVAASNARAAFLAVSNEPNHILWRLFGNLISETYFPHFLFLTPLYYTIFSRLYNEESLISAAVFSTFDFTIFMVYETKY